MSVSIADVSLSDVEPLQSAEIHEILDTEQHLIQRHSPMYLADTSSDTRRDVKECIQGCVKKRYSHAIMFQFQAPNSPKTKIINGVLLLVFPRPDAQTLGT